jgi:non-specific serine/threonine protein kinase
MTLDQVVEFALSRPTRVARKAKATLSQRESQVARMIVGGLTNRQIASELVISERTVDTYVENILNKLGFDRRAQIAAWAAKQGLDAEV